ncbi:MAG: alpha/beta fold hydrolase [Rhodospirillaceae bacterium]
MADKSPLILVPGLLCDEALWAPQMQALADIAECTVAETRRDGNLTNMAVRLLDSAPERFSLAGLSMGGYIAFEVMRLDPDRVQSLALLDTSARPESPERIAIREALAARALSGADGFAGVIEDHIPSFLHPDRLAETALLDTIRGSAANVGADAYVRQQRAIIQRRDQRPNLAAIKCPTLVLCGREDMLTPPELHQEIAAGIPGARLKVVEHCGHLATLERPGAAAAAMRAWLENA